MSSIKKLAILVAMAAAMLWACSPAQAAFTITYHEVGVVGDVTVTLTAGGVLNNASPPGGVFHDYTIGAFARSTSPGVDPSTGQTNLQNVQFDVKVNSPATGDLVVTLTDTGYSNTLGSPVMFEGSVASSFISPGGTVTATHLLNGVTLLGPQTLTSPSGSIDQAVLASPGAGATFSVSNVATVHLPGVALSSAQYTVTTQASPVPAPAGLALVLTGVPVLGVGGWLRRRLKKA
jgi:hypothetical protein